MYPLTLRVGTRNEPVGPSAVVVVGVAGSFLVPPLATYPICPAGMGVSIR